jgi:HSP20 family protein
MTNLFYQNESTVYPGEFVPLVRGKDVVYEHKKRKDTPVAEPATNIIDGEHFYKIEIAIPGVRREDFFIKINRNRLRVIVLHKHSFNETTCTYKLHEFDCDFFKRDIVLPVNADAQLTRAEYREGILYLYIPKNDHPLEYKSCRIVVY